MRLYIQPGYKLKNILLNHKPQPALKPCIKGMVLTCLTVHERDGYDKCTKCRQTLSG